MNAPLSMEIDEVETYKDVLTEDFVQETLERHRLIQENGRASRQSLKNIRKDFRTMAAGFENLGKCLEHSSESFKRLEIVSIRSAEAMSEVGIAAQRLSDTLREQAREIRKRFPQAN